MKLQSTVVFLLFVFALISNNLLAQAPNISYSPSTNVLAIGSPFSLSPANTGGAVAPFAYGAAIPFISGPTLDNPIGMGIDQSGNIYATNYNASDYSNSSVSKFNSGGAYLGAFGAPPNLQQPSGIVFDASGNGYVLNYNRTNNGLGNNHGNAYIDQYSSTGVYGATIIDGLGTANGIAMDAANNLYVAQGSYDNGLNTVSKYNTSGALAFSIAPGHTANPVGVAVDGSYNIYVLDNTNGNVTKYNSTGAYVSTLISGLSNAHAIFIDGAGDIYIGDTGTHTVKVYDLTGTLLVTLTGFTDPQGLVADSQGNLYVSDYTNATITKYPRVGGYFISGTLPPGLSFSSTTGVISGTPTTGFSARTYTITAYNGSGSSSTTVTLSCPFSAVTISYASSIDVYTNGALITTDIASTTGGPTSFISSPTLPVGLNFDASGNIYGTPTANSTATVYTITASNGGGQSGTTTVSIAVVTDNFWTGKISNVWSFGNNWSAHHVPTGLEQASIGVINYPGPDPVVTATTSVNYIRFGSNSNNFTVNSGVTFTVNSDFFVNTNSTPFFQGSGTLNVAATASVSIVGTGVLSINSPLTFTLKSSSTSSATIGQITSGLINGTVNVERYLSAQRGYRLMASPVNAGTVGSNNIYSVNYVKNSAYITGTTGTTGGFDKSGNPTLYLYREDVPVSNTSFITGNYRGINNILSTPTYSLDNEGSTYNIPTSNGYLFFFRGNRASGTLAQETVTTFVATTATFTTSGTLNQGQVVFRNWYNPTSTTLGFSNPNVVAQGFNLAGNPYASSIDWETYNSTSATTGIYAQNVSSFVYELNPVTQTYDVYQKGGAFTNKGTRTIVSGQGFFVLALNSSAQLIFNESAKSIAQNTGLNLMMGKPADQVANNQYLRLQLAKDSIFTDDIMVSFKTNAKAMFDINEDAPYKSGSSKVSLSSMSDDNIALAINKLPLSPKGVKLALKVGATTDGNYKISLKDIAGVPQLYSVWLKDAFTKDSVNMRIQPSYSFNIALADTNTFGSKRFTLILFQDPALAYHLLNFTAAKTDNKQQVEVTWNTVNEQNYTHFLLERSTNNGNTFDVIGGMVSAGQGTYSLLDKSPEKGDNLYRLKQEDYNNAISYSNVVQVQYADKSNNLTGSGHLSVYPNPAVSTINLTIDPKKPVATYSIRVTNSVGTIVTQTVTSQPNWQGNVSNLLTGTYLIQVVNNKDNSLVGQTKFVKL